MERIGVDIGGSGVRLAVVKVGSAGQRHRVVGEVLRPAVTSVGELVAAIEGLHLGAPVGVSAAGFVAHGGEVTTSRAQPWLEGPLRRTLAERLGVDVAVVNDGEAHLLGSLSLVPLGRHPVLALVAGSSLAVAMSDEDGALRRPVRSRNWEFGEMRLNTRATQREAWWALGRRGLDELIRSSGEEAAVAQFGARLGGFAADLAGVFGPRQVMLSGGIVAGFPVALMAAAQAEFGSRLPWWVDARLDSSPYGPAAGVVGAAVAAAMGPT